MNSRVNHRYGPVDPEIRFWANVKKTETCWLWQGAVRNLHGAFWNNGKLIAAHRFTYELHKGQIPKGLCVCHTCDVGLCVNPEHLFLGTHQDNMKDHQNKGRVFTGENVYGAKLTWDMARRIRKGEFGKAQSDIARAVGVNRSTIGSLLRNETWK